MRRRAVTGGLGKQTAAGHVARAVCALVRVLQGEASGVCVLVRTLEGEASGVCMLVRTLEGECNGCQTAHAQQAGCASGVRRKTQRGA